MRVLWGFLASLVLAYNPVLSTPAKRHYDTHNYYVLEHIPEGLATASLTEISSALGLEVVEQVGELKDTWLVRTEKPSVTLEARGEDADPVLVTFSRLRELASSHLASRSNEVNHAERLVSSVKFLDLQVPRQLVKRAPPPIRPPTPTSSHGVAEHFGFKDPLFPEQWHLVNDEYPEHMMNVTGVWEMGLTGKGVLTSFLDDGLDFESDDLKDAFDAKNSYDFNAHVPLPRPTGARDHHGTRCAGQVAARRNNACGVGIAYDAMAAGVRILGGPITSVDEAAALNYGFKDVGVYSCSWGPRDNGQTMEGPNYLIRKAVTNGINNGRDGKGSIFVFASGNGGRRGDQCNFDGYTNSIYSVTVSSIDYKGLHPTYSEACAANMIVAYSSGSGKHIVTTDRGKNECTRSHGGTSAAAPNAVGVFALALEARPDLTWRDIQYLCLETARQVNTNDPDWERTSSGRMYSYKYGYGVLDAYAYVTAAKDWKLVKPQTRLVTDPIQLGGGKMPKKHEYEGGLDIPRGGIENKMRITNEMMVDNNLETLEHIDVRVWINHTRRGDVEVEIVSPKGIRSILAGKREDDEAPTGFPGWRFNSIKHWGENPIGEWIIKVKDQADPDEHGKFLGWNLVLWGTTIDPSKAVKYQEPVVDNALPPVTALEPPRPVLNDPDLTSTTQYSKPTDHLPADHAHDSGDSNRPAFPTTGSEDGDSWFSSAFGLFSSHKKFFGAMGVVVVILIGSLIFLWRRRVAKQQLRYASLAEDDIRMENMDHDAIVGNDGPRTTRALYESFGEPSTDNVPETAGINPPNIPGLGFHSSFLEDDEPSAGLTPKYRDDPDEEDEVRTHPRELADHDSTSSDSRTGSRERLT